MADNYATIREVADHFKLSISTVHNWLRASKIPATTYIKIGSTYRFNLDLLETALLGTAENTTKSNDKPVENSK